MNKLWLGVVFSIFLVSAVARAESTAFTFQGRLNDSGTPANGNYDLQLKLFTTPGVGTGTQIGSTITRTSVKVTNGVFTVQLDFTAAAFPGADRFLEIGLTPSGSGAPVTTLSPRQPITPTPYSIFSANAATATHATTATNATHATNATNATNATKATTATNSIQLNGIAANQYVLTSDSRLTNARAPTAGSGKYIQNQTAGTQSAGFKINGTNTILGSGSLTIDPTTAAIALAAATSSNGEAVYGECLTAGNGCYAVQGAAPAGDYAAYFVGGKGVYAQGYDAAQSGIEAYGGGDSGYGVKAVSERYRGLGTSRNNTAFFSLFVDRAPGESTNNTIAQVAASLEVVGNLTVDGSKSGYVVDIMQNVDNAPLEPGDVVVVVGNSAPVLGQIPVITVKKAAVANDTGLAGIVDQVWSVPDAATKAAYEAQQNNIRVAAAARTTKHAEARASRTKVEEVTMPETTISDEQGVLHALPDTTSVGTGGYVSVVTLGSYKMVKADASFGPIQAGDLLTTSTRPGYAMKAVPVLVNGAQMYRAGTILGKALDPLTEGTGVIKVFVTLR